MADSIANILMQITGESDGADLTLEKLLAKLNAFGHTEATAKADVSTQSASDKIASLTALLAGFGAASVTAEAKVEVDQGSLVNTLAAIEAVSRERVTIGVDLQDQAALVGLVNLATAVKAVENEHIEIDVNERGIVEFLALMKSIGDVDVTVNLDTAEAQQRLIAFLVAAQTLGGDINEKIDVNDAEGIAKLAAFEIAKEAVSGDVNVKVDVNDAAAAVGVMSQLGAKIASVFGNLGGAAKDAVSNLQGVTANLGPFGVKLTGTTVALLALAVAMAVSVVAAAALMVTALAAATAAVGALAVAFVAALGPAVALAIAVFSRITTILQALKAQRQAQQADQARSVSGTKAETAATEAHHNALVALASAIRQQASAERGLDDAKKAAHDAIVQAARDEATAAQNVTDATNNEKEQLVAAYQAIKDSVEQAKEAFVSFESAQLGIKESKLGVDQAVLALKEFRTQSGLAGKQFDDIFKKATNVDANVNLRPLLAKLTPGGGTGNTEADQALKLRQLILAVQRAKISEAQSTNSLTDAETNLNQKRAEAVKFQQQGVQAFKPYTDAVKAQHDAVQRLADATDHANQLEREGIKNNAQVLGAEDALANANARLVEARHDAARTAEAAGGSQQAALAKVKWDALTKSEQAFGLALQNTIKSLKGFFGPAVSGVLGGIASGLTGLPKLFAGVKPAFTQLGNAIGGVFKEALGALTSPTGIKAINGFVQASTQLARILGGSAFKSIGEILGNIATATMPLLLSGSRGFASALASIASKTSDTTRLGKGIQSIFNVLKSVGSLVGSIGGIFLAFFRDTLGQSNSLTKGMTNVTNQIKGFLDSPNGKHAIQDFFHDVIPLAGQTARFIGNIVVLFLQIVQVVAPALTGVLKVLNLFLGIINLVVHALRPFLQIAAQLALLFIDGIPAGIAATIGKFKVLEFFFGGFVDFLRGGFVKAFTFIVGRLALFANAFSGPFDAIKHLVLVLVSFMGRMFDGLVNIMVQPFKITLNAIESLGKDFLNAGKFLVNQIVKGIESVPKALYNGVKKVLGPIGDLLPGSEPKDPTSPLAGLPKRGQAILTNLALNLQPGSADLAKSMHRALTPVVGSLSTSLSAARPVMAGAGGPNYNGPYIAHQDVNVPPAPGHSGMGDATTQAAILAMEMRRRGRG